MAIHFYIEIIHGNHYLTSFIETIPNLSFLFLSVKMAICELQTRLTGADTAIRKGQSNWRGSRTSPYIKLIEAFVWKCSRMKGVLTNFAKFIGKYHKYISIIPLSESCWQKTATSLTSGVFWGKFCKIFKNTHFTEYLRERVSLNL